jgi:hypothetical protein
VFVIAASLAVTSNRKPWSPWTGARMLPAASGVAATFSLPRARWQAGMDSNPFRKGAMEKS